MADEVWRPSNQNLLFAGQHTSLYPRHILSEKSTNKKKCLLACHLPQKAFALRPGLLGIPQAVHDHVRHLPGHHLVFDIGVFVKGVE